jgi:predicted nucleotidyltransferase
MQTEVAAFLAEFASWARARADVRALALVGSQARGAARADSDIDLIILTTDVDSYFRERSWPALFGAVATARAEDWGRVAALRVFYADGLEVEYNFAAPDWADVPADAGTRRVVADGVRILADPHGLLERLQRAVMADEK